MRQAKQKFKEIFSTGSHPPNSLDRGSQRLPTAGLRIADVVLDTLPIPGAAAVVHSILDVVERINKSRHDAKIIADLNRHIDSLASVLEPICRIDRSEISPDLDKDIEALITELSVLATEWGKGTTRSVFDHLDKSRGVDEVHAFAKGIKRALDGFQTKRSVKREQESILREHARLLDSLPRAKHAGYSSGRCNARNTCFEGTREAILQDINAWIENPDPNTPPIFWLNGLAGIGKSTISQTVAEDADERGLLGASFFFSRGDGALTDPLMVFPTLAFQLAQFDQTFKHRIGVVLEKKPDAGHLALPQQLEELIIAPLRSLAQTDRPVVLIILDALDECERHGAQELLRLLFSHIPCLPFVRILITSRPEPHIRSVFSQQQNHAKAVLHDVEASVIEHDILIYLRSELAEIPKRLNKSMPSSWVSEDDVAALVRKAGKLFVYAATSVRFIGDESVRNPRIQVDVILSLQEAPEAAPFADLDDLYLQLLLPTLPKSNPKFVLDRFQSVVGSIILLRDPLPLDALARFVKYDDDSVSTVLSQLHSVIIPPPRNNDAPRIYHPSFPDFLIDPSRCTDLRFTIAVATHERRHTLRCFELMSTFLKRDLVGIKDPSLLNIEVEGLEQKVEDAIPSEARYACRYWATHLSCVKYGDEDVIRALKDFAMRLILWWLESMSLIGSIPSVAGLIQEAYDWATSSKCDPDLVTILSDAGRFIGAHSAVIIESALHVYYSALPFVPKNTLLYNTYSHEGDRSIKVLQGVESNWPPCLSTLQGHSSDVLSVVFSPDGLRVASGSDDCTVRLWDVMSGTNIATLEGHSSKVSSVVFSPDGLRVASGSKDKTIRLWDVMSGANTATLQGHASGICSVVFSPDGLRLASGSRDHTVRLWDVMSGTNTLILKGHSDVVYSVAFSLDGLRVASGSGDTTVRLWDVMSGTNALILEGHSSYVSSVVFSPDGLRVASASWDSIIRLWDVMSGANTLILKGHSSVVYSVAFSPDGQWLASGSLDYAVRLWDAMSGASTATLQGQASGIYSLVFSSDGLRLASGSWDHTVRLWDVMSGANIATLEGHSSKVSSVAFSPDGLQLATGSSDKTVRLWDVMSGRNTATLDGHLSSVNSVAFSMDASALICHTYGGRIFVWDLTSRPPCRIDSKSPVPRVLLAGWTPLFIIRSRWIGIIQTPNSQFRQICRIPPLYSPMSHLGVLTSGRRIVFGCESGEVMILSTENLEI